ncbi:MAG TPA: L,D-transpeptidase [Methylomirabilota bacterium]|nr:L,D-transpeptidase [Methylomirabilota bacterium]
MPRRKQRSTLNARSRPATSLFRWLLVLLAISGLAWIIWESELPESKPPPQSDSRSFPRIANVPAPTSRTLPLLPLPDTNLPPDLETGPPVADTTPPAQPEPPPIESPPALAEPPPEPESTPPAPTGFPRPVQDVFETQLALARRGLSPGSIDGIMGAQTRAALLAFQQREHLPATGELDDPTRDRLLLTVEPYRNYTVSADDFTRLRHVPATWLGKSQLDHLDYESILELTAELSFSSPRMIRRLNPELPWDALQPGDTIRIPNAANPDIPGKVDHVRIRLADRILQAFDAGTNLVIHFPCSIAQRVDKRPIGLLFVEVLAPDPNYTFNPELFPDSDEGRQLDRKLIIPPGPNNPVGTAWIGLNRSGYGIHGTPEPEKVGRTESLGCFRLANWNAELLLSLVRVGTPVHIED